MPPSGIWCVISRQAFSSANASTSTIRGGQAGGGDRGAALLDVLGARSDQQHVDRLAILLGRPQHLEVVADLIHREGDVLVGLHLDLRFEVAVAQAARHLDHLGDRRIAADRDGDLAALGAGALDGAADRLAHRLRVDQRLLVHRIRRRGLGRVGFDAVLPPAIASSISLMDEVVMSSPSSWRYLRDKRNTFYFLFRGLRLKMTALYQSGDAYISALS